MLSNDIKDKMSAVQHEWRGLFTPDNSILSHGVRSHVLTKKMCVVHAPGEDRYTCRTPHFHMYSHSTEHTAQMTCAHWLKELEGSRRVVRRTLSSTSPVLLSSSSTNPDLLSTYRSIHWEDPRQDGTLRNSTPPQVLSPKRTELNKILVNPQNQTIDDQDDIEEIGVKKLSNSESLVHSTYDWAESTATPPDFDLDDDQLRKMPASPLYIRKREENEGQAQAYHSEREKA